MGYFKHATAIVETDQVGDGTRIWAFAHVLPGARIGNDCNICDHTFLENDVTVGDRVTIKCGVQLWDGIHLENDVFVGPNVTFTNDRYPRSKQRRLEMLKTIVKRGASIGAGATILPGLVIGEKAMIGAGAVLTHHAPPYSKLVGNPARITGYVDVKPEAPAPKLIDYAGNPAVIGLGEAFIHRLPHVEDLRGSLSFGETFRNVPFEIRRYFLVHGVQDERIRGEHAHRHLHQFLVCVAGRCNVVTDDGRHRHEVVLDSPSKGLHIPPMVWATQYKFSADAVLLVLASEYYDAQEYIRDYDEYLNLRGVLQAHTVGA
jgi:acetyltransferase-like isoleucine patch superfamily enzyme/dTDP-4-dehydrorhamnose 3,5-epimerase-like enzyme